MQDRHRPCIADYLVPRLSPTSRGCPSSRGRGSTLDPARWRRARLWRDAGGSLVATRQITPQGRGLLCGPIDEGVDCLAASGPQQCSFPDFNQPEICSGVHPSASRSPTNRRKAASRSRIASAASWVDRLRQREAARYPPKCVPLQAPGRLSNFRQTERPEQWRPSTAPQPAKRRSGLFRPPTDANRIAWQHS